MSEIRRLTRLGADPKRIARLLQAKGRGGDTILAHINPTEAALLKARGGSGSTNPETGLLEFQNDFDAGDFNYAMPSEVDYGSPVEDVSSFSPSVGDVGVSPDISDVYGLAPEFGAAPAFADVFSAPVTPTTVPAAPQYFGTPETETRGFTPEIKPAAAEPGRMDRLAQALGLSRQQLSTAGLGLASSLLARQQAAGAQRQGQQQAQQMQAIAQPYRQQGQQLLGAAQRGELTPAAQQQMQAAQAQVAQQVQQAGGVGASQAARQIEDLRQRLLQNQWEMGLRLAGIGDEIAVGAIKTGLQADQYVQQLTGQYYNNIFRTLFSMVPGSKPATPPAGG